MMYKVFVSILETFLVFGFGALAWRLRMIKSTDLGRLSRLTLDLFFPLLTFSTITRNFDPSNLSELWLMPVLGIAIMLVGANPEYKDAAGHLIGGNNMAAVHLANAVGGNLFLGFISAVAFATILAVVAGLTLAGASAVSHDLYANVFKKGAQV